MIASLKQTTKYLSRSRLAEFAALHFTPDPDHVGNVIIKYRRADDEIRRVLYCAADRLPETLAAMELHQRDYYITANSFSGGSSRTEELFTLHNIVIDIDAHSEWLDDQQRDRMIESLAYFAERDLQTIPNTIVKTGRGLQLWYAIEPISYKAAHRYNVVREKLISEAEQLLRDVPALTGLSLDSGASHSTAGIFRMPGTYNSKTDAEGSFEIIHEERISIPEEYRKITAEQIIKPGSSIQRMPKGGSDALRLAQMREGSFIKLRQIRRADGLQAGEELRNNFIFCMYNSWMSVLQDHDQAMKRVVPFNQGFIDPLTDHELRNYLSTSERKRYTLTNVKIIEMLGITQEEQMQIGLHPAGTVKRDSREQLRQDARDRKAERDAKICELFLQGLQQNEIAEKVGCSAPTVGNVLKRCGRASRRQQLHDQICELIREGCTPAETAERISVSLSTVYDHIRKAREAGQILTCDDANRQVEELTEENNKNATEPKTGTQEDEAKTDERPTNDRGAIVLHKEFREIKKTRLSKGASPLEDPAALWVDQEQLERRRRLIEHIAANRARRARLGISSPWDQIPLPSG